MAVTPISRRAREELFRSARRHRRRARRGSQEDSRTDSSLPAQHLQAAPKCAWPCRSTPRVDPERSEVVESIEIDDGVPLLRRDLVRGFGRAKFSQNRRRHHPSSDRRPEVRSAQSHELRRLIDVEAGIGRLRLPGLGIGSGENEPAFAQLGFDCGAPLGMTPAKANRRLRSWGLTLVRSWGSTLAKVSRRLRTLSVDLLSRVWGVSSCFWCQTGRSHCFRGRFCRLALRLWAFSGLVLRAFSGLVLWAFTGLCE